MCVCMNLLRYNLKIICHSLVGIELSVTKSIWKDFI